jgi:hypothetical protein
VLFGVVLAWGEMQTRHLGREQQRARKSAQASDTVRVIQAIARDTANRRQEVAAD